MAIGEFELIAKFFTDIGPRSAAIALGIGDDCALIDPPAGRQLALSADTLVADVHFPAHGDPASIAQKALRTNLSDLAAMGAEPLAFTLALTLPAADETWLAGFSHGLRACADEFAIPLIGGDTTRGPQLVISIQIVGSLPRGAALTRAGAQAGDSVFVSGTLGDARAALDYLSTPAALLDDAQRFFLRRYYEPTPRLEFGRALRGLASAAIDISDGFAADLGHILARSDIGAEIDTRRLPLSGALRTRVEAIDFALHGGDDYELCFTAPPQHRAAIVECARATAVPITEVGRVVAEHGLFTWAEQGRRVALNAAGYRHF